MADMKWSSMSETQILSATVNTTGSWISTNKNKLLVITKFTGAGSGAITIQGKQSSDATAFDIGTVTADNEFAINATYGIQEVRAVLSGVVGTISASVTASGRV